MTTFEYYNDIYKENLSVKKITIEPFFSDLMHATLFLPQDATYTERIYCLLNNITTRPRCTNKECSNIVKFPSNARKADRFYRTFCSTKCSNNSVTVQQLKAATCFKNFGVYNPSCNVTIKDAKALTSKNNYGGVGFASPSINLKIRNTMYNKYGNEDISKTYYWKQQTEGKLLINSRYSREATSYIESYLTVNNIDKKLCRYKESEIFLKDSKGKIFFYDLVVFDNIKAAKDIDITKINLILEYDGLFWHPTIHESISFRNITMPVVGKTYREKYLYDLHKERLAKTVLASRNGKFIRVRSKR